MSADRLIDPSRLVKVIDRRGGRGKGIIAEENLEDLSEETQQLFSQWMGAVFTRNYLFAQQKGDAFQHATGITPEIIVQKLAELENGYRSVNQQYGWDEATSKWHVLLRLFNEGQE